MHNGVAEHLHIFKNTDKAFIIAIMPLMRPLKLNDEEFLYKEGAFPDEIFFIVKGRVNLVLSHNEIAYKSYLKNTYIGEIEIVLKKINREDNA